MKCNKDEARKAMEIAEKKISENDYNGAKKFVEKAQTLYPQLDGLEQMSMIIHVFISASNKIDTGGGGREETDWYGVLCVDPSADEEAVKKQYKKLALLLHPDKNRFKGAEDACKLVLEAWSLLSDKVMRTAYDQKRKSNEVKMQKPPNPQKPSASSNVDPSANATSNSKPAPAPENSSEQSKGGAFWTLCNECKSLCEYLRDLYLYKVVRCPNCDKTFIATENSFWGKIMREVDLRLALLRQREKNKKTNGASSFGTSYQTQEPPNAYNKPASSNWNQNASHGVDPSAYATSNNHAPPPSPAPAPAPVKPSKEIRAGYFWTLCNGCNTLCEYWRDRYLNKTIRCPNCGHTSIATDYNLWGKVMREVDYTLFLVLQQQQQRSAQNTSGGTYYPSASVPANGTLEILEKIFGILDEALAAAVVGYFL
ncbi:unnamed protein product [Microthlaspi erraticum]|uniref:J domain-containing protein n=1 Tax=Microthlaspi erraticum TaxID=1685480 RepID=A0A6D2KR58_9BRAS|nr:unnamed protein product [Microthlaspi erraticum]